ncbi:MAG: cation:proton antiporter [Thermoplasmata archaeon]
MAGEAMYLADFALVMGAAAVVALLFRHLRLPLLPGYILAGVILATVVPRTGLVSSASSIDLMSSLGMALLFFSIGLKFSLRRLRSYGLLVVFIACIEVSLCLAGGYWLGLILGWSGAEAAALGGMVAVTSTVMIYRQLARTGRLRWPSSRLMLGIAIVEDAAAVVIIAFFSSVEAGLEMPLGGVLMTVLRMVLFAVFAIALGAYVVPRGVDWVARRRSRELTVLTALGLCFGMAGLAQALGMSASIGAFVMGVIAGEARSARMVEREMGAVRDFFIALFFVTIGFYATLGELLSALPLGLLVATAFIGLNFGSIAFACLLGGRSREAALRVSLGMLAMGEFSFVIAMTAEASGSVTKPLLAVALIASLVTSALHPYMVRAGDALVARATRSRPSGLGIYCSTSAEWVGVLKKRMKRNPALLRGAARFARSMFLSGLIIAATALAAGWAVPQAGWVAERLSMDPFHVQLSFLLPALAVLLVQSVIIARRVQRFIAQVSSAVVHGSSSARAAGEGLVRRFFANVAAASLSVVLMAFLSLLLPFSPVQRTLAGAIAIALLVAAAYFFEDSLHRVNRRLEGLLLSPGRPQAAPRPFRGHRNHNHVGAEYPARGAGAEEDFRGPGGTGGAH